MSRWAHGSVFGAVAFGGSVVLSGCQDTHAIGVHNECGTAIEAVADESPGFPDYLKFKRIEPGEVKRLLTASESFDEVFAWVRAVGDEDQGRRFSVPASDLVEGLHGERDFVIDVSSGQCP